MYLRRHPPNRNLDQERIKEVKEIESFVKYQNESKESYRKWEEEHWEKELELDEKRSKENQEHEIRLFQMLGQMVKPGENYPASPYKFEYEH